MHWGRGLKKPKMINVVCECPLIAKIENMKKYNRFLELRLTVDMISSKEGKSRRYKNTLFLGKNL